MRWLKHMTATPDDEKVAMLLAQHGPFAYGVWWLVLEKIALSMKKDATEASLTYPVSTWATVLRVPPQHVEMRLSQVAGVGLLKVSSEAVAGGVEGKSGIRRIRVEVPNLLKYRDEYSQRSGPTPDSLPSKQQQQQQQQHTTDTQTDGSQGFDPENPKTVLGNPLPVLTITYDTGAVRENPEWLCVRDALRAAEERIRRARNPTLYERKIIEASRKRYAEWRSQVQ